MSTRHRLSALLCAAGIVAALGLAGCGASNSASPSTTGGDAGMPGEIAAPGVAEAPKDGFATNGGDANQAPVQVEQQERSLIYTGSIGVTVDNVSQKADQAADIAVGLGGAVGGDRRSLNGDRSSAELVLRVPADKFSNALDELAKLGTEETRAIQTQDVTEQLVDLDARLATQRASVERVRALLARAQTIGEVVSIEGELTRREADLASLEQRKDRLGGLVALSTITVNLRGPAAPEIDDESDTGFVAGLKNGWDAFLASVTILLTVAGWLLPWTIAIVAPIWLLVWLVRRRGRPRVVTTTPPAAAE